MKTRILILTIFLVLGLTSCIQDDVGTEMDQITDPVENIVDVSWRITYFWDSDHEETDHFTNYIFTFESGGVVMATNGVNTYSGSWNEGIDDSTLKLYLSFTTPSDFEELSDDWHVLEWTNSIIRLRDVSGGNGGTDLLTFEKI